MRFFQTSVVTVDVGFLRARLVFCNRHYWHVREFGQLFTPCVFFPCSSILDEDEDMDSGMQSRSTDGEVPPLIVPPCLPGIVAPIMTVLDVKTDSLFNLQLQDSEYCNNRYVLNNARI